MSLPHTLNCSWSGEEATGTEQGQVSCRAWRHQPRTAEGLCIPALVELHIYLSPVLEKVSAQWKTSYVVPVPKTGQHREPDKGIGEHHPVTPGPLCLRVTLDNLQFGYRLGICADDAFVILLHWTFLHLDDSTAFTTYQPTWLRVRIEAVSRSVCTINYLNNRRYVRHSIIVSEYKDPEWMMVIIDFLPELPTYQHH